MKTKINKTMQKILNSAEILFSEKGYDATSIEDITKHAGTTKALFFYYFKTKRDILFTLMKSKRDEAVNTFIEQNENGEINITKDEIYKGCISFITNNQNIFRIALFEFLKTSSGTNIMLELPKEIFAKFEDMCQFSKEEQLKLIITVIKTTLFVSVSDNLCSMFDVSVEELKKLYE